MLLSSLWLRFVAVAVIICADGCSGIGEGSGWLEALQKRTSLPVRTAWVLSSPKPMWVFPKIGVPPSKPQIEENPLKETPKRVPLFFGVEL